MPDDKPQSAFTEKLVAYLDGELPDGAAREVEQALASDPTIRADVAKLSRVWELLDLLPRPNASGTFSSRTLATLKAGDIPTSDAPTDVAATELVAEIPSRRLTTFSRAAWIAGLLIIAVWGFAAGRRNAQTQSEPLLDDLPVIEHLDLLSEIGDAEFLRELHRKGILHERPIREPQ